MAGREDTGEPSDRDLVALAATGDDSAFTALYERHQGAVYRFALHMTLSPQMAEDVVQEVFVALMRGLARYDPARPLSAYLVGAARHITRRRLRRERRLVPLDPARTVARIDPDLSAHLDRSDRLRRLRAALVALPPRHREVVVLCDLQQLSYEVAADVLHCPVGTVRSRLHRARALLLSLLQEQETSRAQRIAKCVV